MAPFDESDSKSKATLQAQRFDVQRASTPNPEKAAKIVPSPRTEQFPVLPPDTDRFPPKKGTKARSLTEAEIAAGVMKHAVIDFIAENLKSAEPPLSLEQDRKRRATMKDIRKTNVEFLVARTAVRTAIRDGTLQIPAIRVTAHDNVEVRARAASAAASTSSGGLYDYNEMRSSLNHLEEHEDHKD